MHLPNLPDDNNYVTGNKFLDYAITLALLATGYVFDGMHTVHVIANMISWATRNFSYGAAGLLALCNIFPGLKVWIGTGIISVVQYFKRLF